MAKGISNLFVRFNRKKKSMKTKSFEKENMHRKFKFMESYRYD
ncbi:hypothetical protein [Eubacterium sp. MSJ-33]|nr:hypothetical protein [Eubacterium sp. MSJ-33]